MFYLLYYCHLSNFPLRFPLGCVSDPSTPAFMLSIDQCFIVAESALSAPVFGWTFYFIDGSRRTFSSLTLLLLILSGRGVVHPHHLFPAERWTWVDASPGQNWARDLGADFLFLYATCTHTHTHTQAENKKSTLCEWQTFVCLCLYSWALQTAWFVKGDN